MDELKVIEILKQFFGGDTLVLAYVAYSLVRLVLKPLYRNGGIIRELAVATTKALNSGVFSHDEIVVELRALNAFLSKD